jgi:hypothetical protein
VHQRRERVGIGLGTVGSCRFVRRGGRGLLNRLPVSLSSAGLVVGLARRAKKKCRERWWGRAPTLWDPKSA